MVKRFMRAGVQPATDPLGFVRPEPSLGWIVRQARPGPAECEANPRAQRDAARRREAAVKAAVLVASLGLAVFVSSPPVYVKFQNRERWSTLQRLEEERDELNGEWSRLQLELGAWAMASRVERIARDQLGMIVPPAKDVRLVRDE